MDSLRSIVETCTAALQAVTPQNLSSGILVDAKHRMKAVDVEQGINNFLAKLPARPEDDHQIPDWEALMHKNASELNHSASLFNKELSRLKEMQEVLHIPQLEELIHTAQEIIRPIYNFTAQLSV